MIRPMTSSVSALSGIVANGHQAIHFVSSAPSKIPYGGFSPVRLQASLSMATFAYLRFIRHLSGGLVSGVVPWQSSRAPVHILLRTRPMALGSPAGFVVPQDRRLLWPYPSFCSLPFGLVFMSAWPFGALAPACRRSPIYSASPLAACRHHYSGGSSRCL
jgi:hypothetical protein